MTQLTDDDERLARLAHAFLRTEYGQYLVSKLADVAYQLHLAAEDAETCEGKAFKIERAAGVRKAIELMTSNAQLYEAEMAAAKQKK